MKVLLTGGAGYIGSHTVIEMTEAGHDVVVVDNFSNSSPKSIARTEQILGKKIPLYEADVADAAVFLASEESSYINGQILHVDGGYDL